MAFIDAFIQVQVTNFVAATGTSLSLSQATFTLTDTSDPTVFSQNGTVFNVGAKARIVFYFTGGYVPQDLWFLQTVGTDDGNGKKNMKEPQDTAYNGMPAFEIKDNLTHGFRGAQWKILIPIVNSSGQAGLVDPEIANTDEEPRK